MTRRYNDEEVALILAEAAALERDRGDGDGTSLADIERAAADAGLDAAMVRRAAAALDRRASSAWDRADDSESSELVLRRQVVTNDIDALVGRLFGAMADRTGQPGEQSRAGDAVLWKTRDFGQGWEPGQGPRISLTVLPRDGGAEVVLRESVQSQNVATRLGTTALGGGAGLLISIAASLSVGAADEAALLILAVGSAIGASVGWLAGKVRWRHRRAVLAAQQGQKLEELHELATGRGPGLALDDATDRAPKLPAPSPSGGDGESADA